MFSLADSAGYVVVVLQLYYGLFFLANNQALYFVCLTHGVLGRIIIIAACKSVKNLGIEIAQFFPSWLFYRCKRALNISIVSGDLWDSVSLDRMSVGRYRISYKQWLRWSSICYDDNKSKNSDEDDLAWYLYSKPSANPDQISL